MAALLRNKFLQSASERVVDAQTHRSSFLIATTGKLAASCSSRLGKGATFEGFRGIRHPLGYNLGQYKRAASGHAPGDLVLRFFGVDMPHVIHVRCAHALRQLLVGLLVGLSFLFAGAARADDYSDVSRLLESGQLAEAARKADQFLATKPRDPQMRFLKAVILTEQGQTSAAIAAFIQLTEDYPELPEPYNNLAVLYAGQNQYEKARSALEMAIRTNPSYGTAHENLGDVYARLASQAYSRALQLDSSNTAVGPKLALIRDLFAPETAKGRKPPPPAPRPVQVVQPVAITSTLPAMAAASAAKPPASSGGGVTVPTAGAQAPAVATATSAPTAKAQEHKAAVEAALTAWAKAWSDKDLKAYFAAYQDGVDPSGKSNRNAWQADRRARIEGKKRISVKLSNVEVSVNGQRATARFRQTYSADGLNVSSRKTLEFVSTGERWLIVRESTGS